MRDLVFAVAAVVAIYYAAIAGSILIEGCNEAQCVADVSKCQILGSCSCTLDNCSCCANCTRCLKELWEPCCACVGLCKPPNNSMESFSHVSTIGNLIPIPSLFNSLAEDTFEVPWTFQSIPHEEEDISLYRPPSLDGQSGITAFTDNSSYLAELCTIAYIDECLPMMKCKHTCSSMGAARYRWFHNACCQCIGHTCISYGKIEPLCKACSVDW